MNLNYYFPPVYWNTACLTVESQSDDKSDKANGQTDYGKIAKAIYKMRNFNVEVLPPNINKSNVSFTPNEEDNTILFGLAGISGINMDIAKQIIDKRPYIDFEDFYNKHSYKGSLITKSKFITLIKSGCFDETDDRINAMKWLVVYENPAKESLTTANIANAISIGVKIPQNLLDAYNFKKSVICKNNFYKADPKFKSKKHYIIRDYDLDYFENKCLFELKEELDYYYENDNVIVVDKSLEKALKTDFDKLSELINTQEFLDAYNGKNWAYIYNEMIDGIEDLNKWSFDSISFYANGDHELATINFADYNISKFSELSEEPNFLTKSYGSRSWKQYDIARICGTVLDRKDNGHFINLLTPDNEVVTVKFNKDQYSYYKQTIDYCGLKDENYFKRGTMLMISGYRNGEDEFMAKKYKNSLFSHTVIKITKVNDDGTMELQLNRLGQEED